MRLMVFMDRGRHSPPWPGTDLVRDGTQLMDADHTFGYEVAAACSGIRSLTALLALTTIYGFVTFKSRGSAD